MMKTLPDLFHADEHGLNLCANKWPYSAGSFPSQGPLFCATVDQESRSPCHKQQRSQGANPTMRLGFPVRWAQTPSPIHSMGCWSPHPFQQEESPPSFTFQLIPSSSAPHVPADEFPALLDGAYSPTKMLWG